MDIKVMIPSSKLDFNFDSASTSPYISAPSSPQQRFNSTTAFYYSAPTSPNRASAFYRDDDDLTAAATSSSVPFGWEEKPGLPKSSASSNYGDAEDDNDISSDHEFAFDFSGQFETASLHADELFDGGKIKPLKPPPRFEFSSNSFYKPPESPRSPKKMIQDAFVRKKKDYDFDPFQTALEIQTRKENVVTTSAANRGRSSEKKANNTKDSHSRRKSNGARSLSPFRVSDLLLDPEEKTDPNPSSLSMFPWFWYKKWKIRDLLLFRSASESRASELRKVSNVDRDAKNSSFRSVDGSVGSVSSRRRTGPRVSAQELHYYNMSRAVTEEMKKRTFLPYKQGVLGCLGFVPSVPNMSR